VIALIIIMCINSNGMFTCSSLGECFPTINYWVTHVKITTGRYDNVAWLVLFGVLYKKIKGYTLNPYVL
jgi:hypothetical protein